MPTKPPAKSKPRAKAKLEGGGAIAQGKRSTAVGKRGVAVKRDNNGVVNTGTLIQNYIQRAAQPGATTADLRRAYLAWLSARANELPLMASDNGAPVQLSSVYTALLTNAAQPDAEFMRQSGLRAVRVPPQASPRRLGQQLRVSCLCVPDFSLIRTSGG